MTSYFLMRHGEAAFPLARERRLKGWGVDLVPLTPAGVEQVAQAATLLRPVGAQVIVSSPMTRALQSAAILAGLLALPLDVEFDLHEWVPDTSFTWETIEQVRAAEADFARHGGEWPDGVPRGWEPLSSVRRRMLGALERYRRYDRVIVVGHTVAISSLTGRQSRYAEVSEYQL